MNSSMVECSIIERQAVINFYKRHGYGLIHIDDRYAILKIPSEQYRNNLLFHTGFGPSAFVIDMKPRGHYSGCHHNLSYESIYERSLRARLGSLQGNKQYLCIFDSTIPIATDLTSAQYEYRMHSSLGYMLHELQKEFPDMINDFIFIARHFYDSTKRMMFPENIYHDIFSTIIGKNTNAVIFDEGQFPAGNLHLNGIPDLLIAHLKTDCGGSIRITEVEYERICKSRKHDFKKMLESMDIVEPVELKIISTQLKQAKDQLLTCIGKNTYRGSLGAPLVKKDFLEEASLLDTFSVYTIDERGNGLYFPWMGLEKIKVEDTSNDHSALKKALSVALIRGLRAQDIAKRFTKDSFDENEVLCFNNPEWFL